jgi:hypothetical protein
VGGAEDAGVRDQHRVLSSNTCGEGRGAGGLAFSEARCSCPRRLRGSSASDIGVTGLADQLIRRVPTVNRTLASARRRPNHRDTQPTAAWCPTPRGLACDGGERSGMRRECTARAAPRSAYDGCPSPLGGNVNVEAGVLSRRTVRAHPRSTTGGATSPNLPPTRRGQGSTSSACHWCARRSRSRPASPARCAPHPQTVRAPCRSRSD